MSRYSAHNMTVILVKMFSVLLRNPCQFTCDPWRILLFSFGGNFLGVALAMRLW
jgi:hypothetical protein